MGASLHIPSGILDIIESEYPTEVECLRAAVRYWLLYDPYASWRRLIMLLDGMKERSLANTLRENAENITGESHTTITYMYILTAAHIVLSNACHSTYVCIISIASRTRLSPPSSGKLN